MSEDQLLKRAIAFLFIAAGLVMIFIVLGGLLPLAIEDWRRVLAG